MKKPMNRAQALHEGLCYALQLDPDARGTRAKLLEYFGDIVSGPQLSKIKHGRGDLETATVEEMCKRVGLQLIPPPEGSWTFRRGIGLPPIAPPPPQ